MGGILVIVLLPTSSLSCLQEGRETTPEMATSPRRQVSQVPGSGTSGVRQKEPPPMVVQGDFRKVRFCHYQAHQLPLHILSHICHPD